MSISLPVGHQSDYMEGDQLVIHPAIMRMESSRRSYWRKVWYVAAKDLRIEMRAKEILGVMAAFSILAVIIFGMAFDLRVPRSVMVAPGVLWGAAVYRSFRAKP
ncbi:MAG: heme exporter protein CcmB [Caldilineaceae bacterium]